MVGVVHGHLRVVLRVLRVRGVRGVRGGRGRVRGRGQGAPAPPRSPRVQQPAQVQLVHP